MRYVKYHALGNDYLVMQPADLGGEPVAEKIQRICHRNFGVGSDGILLGPLPSSVCDFRLRIFNPDGSEAEKSGNGLRIFSRFLQDEGLVGTDRFTIETLGGSVACQVAANGANVTVAMGTVSFHSEQIPVLGSPREVLSEHARFGDRDFEYCAATIGNPHCVVLCEKPTREDACRYGPAIERDPRFPNRTNVQFMQVLDRGNLRIEIWERGAGYTLASGSSSTAAAAVARRLGLCDAEIVVHMPGGCLQIRIADDYTATMRGPVVRICHGDLDREMWQYQPA
jgi:diaminopimelate epimerase